MRARTVVLTFGAVAIMSFAAGALDRGIVLASGADHRYELVSAGGLMSAMLLGVAWAILALIAFAACTLVFVAARTIAVRLRGRGDPPATKVNAEARMSATRAATLLSFVVLVLASPVILLAAFSIYIDWPRYAVDSSSLSADGRFRLDNEAASTFDRSYRRIRLVRVGSESDDRLFCEAAGGDLVGTFVGNDAFVITFPDYALRDPSPAVFSERVQFDPNDLGHTEVTLLSGASTC